MIHTPVSFSAKLCQGNWKCLKNNLQSQYLHDTYFFWVDYILNFFLYNHSNMSFYSGPLCYIKTLRYFTSCHSRSVQIHSHTMKFTTILKKKGDIILNDSWIQNEKKIAIFISYMLGYFCSAVFSSIFFSITCIKV